MNNPTISIRHAHLRDLPQIHTLFVEAISEVCKNDYSPAQINAWTSSIENTRRWTAKLENQYFLIAHIKNTIVGFASLENSDYFDFMYVHKDFQRQGIATMLYMEIESEAIRRGAETLTSDVSVTAKPFFEKRGFKAEVKQTQNIQGISIVNFKMRKNCCPFNEK